MPRVNHISRCHRLVSAVMLLVLGLLGAQDLAAQPDETPLARVARDFIGLLSQGKFDDAEKLIAPPVRQTLSAASLAQAWRSLETRHGKYQNVGRLSTEKLEERDVVNVSLQFEQRSFEARVILDEQAKVIGLLFGGAGPKKAATSPPPYADPSAFAEQDFMVLSGQFRLPGTATLPKSGAPFPVVLLVASSGPNDRDETIGPNKPLRDVAWGLATLGIASIRYDKRTLVYGPRLDIRDLTYKEEVVEDAVSAIRQLRKDSRFKKERVYLLGHGLGGQLAPAVSLSATTTRAVGLFSSNLLAGLVIMAGPARSLPATMIDHLNYIAMQDGVFTLQERSAILEFQAGVESLLDGRDRNAPPVMGFTYNYLNALRSYDCVKSAQKAGVAMLVAQGGRDCQVTVTHDFQAWKDGLEGRDDVAFRLYPNLNHLFMAGQGKSYPSEYQEPAHVDEQFINDVAAWIHRTPNDK